MRIFQAIHYKTNPRVSDNQTWYRNLHEPLLDMGHDVFIFPTDKGHLARKNKSSKLQAQFSQELLDTFLVEHNKNPFSLFFSYLTDGMLDVNVLDEIKKLGIPMCNFSCNNTHQFHLVSEISTHFEYNLHTEKDAREKFLAIGANPLWWPMASNPKYFKPIEIRKDFDVSFVGANYALRSRYITHLLHAGVDVHVFGPGWRTNREQKVRSILKRYFYLLKASFHPAVTQRHIASRQLADHDTRSAIVTEFPNNVHSSITDEELIALYSRSYISLGFLEVYQRNDPSQPVKQHLHLREFEAPMSGALYCTGYMDELAEMFEPGKEVIVYRNQHELLEKVKYFLTHPDEADKIRAAGRARALKEHTYHHRFKFLFNTLGL